MELSERKKRILAAVVEEYIDSAEPVGSRRVLELSGLTCSSATVRSELSQLESEGYLEQPHTSAGRIPTAKGYRFYVNELMRARPLTPEEAAQIDTGLGEGLGTPEKLIGGVGKLATELTSYPALTLSAPGSVTIRRFDLLYIDPNTFIIVLLLTGNTVKNKLIRLPFSFEESLVTKLATVFNASFTGIPEEEITPQLIQSAERSVGDTMGLTSVIAGFAIETLTAEKNRAAQLVGGENLLKLPEYRDTDKAHRLMTYLSGAAVRELPSFEGSGDVKVLIGPENVAEELKDTSVILASYDAGDNMRGVIGVVGPTRMDYSLVAAKLSYIADGLSRLLGGHLPPPGFGKLMIKSSEGDEKHDEEKG